MLKAGLTAEEASRTRTAYRDELYPVVRMKFAVRTAPPVRSLCRKNAVICRFRKYCVLLQQHYGKDAGVVELARLESE